MYLHTYLWLHMIHELLTAFRQKSCYEKAIQKHCLKITIKIGLYI